MGNETKTVGWEMSIDVIDGFTGYCDTTNDRYGDAMSAAMVLWQYMPATIQRLAQLEANGVPSVDPDYWEKFAQGLNESVLDRLRDQSSKDQRA